MHITSGLSPASDELLEPSINFYGDGGDLCDTPYFAIDHTVPESSHTVEIEYVYEQPEAYIQTDVNQDAGQTNVQKKDAKNIRTKHWPEKMEEDESEGDLTNLTWLQNITNIMQVPQFPMTPIPPAKLPQPQSTRLEKFNRTIAKCQKDFMENKEEYQSNSEKKPPYSYSTIICMAMRYNDDKMTLSAIYSWIRDNFKYYRKADPTWQNSIRHNLSLNKVFVKVARSKQEPGKGGFWKLDLGHLEGDSRLSNRPQKKKKAAPKQAETESVVIQQVNMDGMGSDAADAVTLHLPDFNLGSIQPDIQLDLDLQAHIGANVIVEPIEPPPLIPEDVLSSLLMSPTDWDDLQLDMLDNYLDGCFK